MKGHNNCFNQIRLGAALLVFYAHCYPIFGVPGADLIFKLTGFLDGGSLGVGIFFAISGYLVTKSLARSPDVTDFLTRRAKRIFPGLAAVLLLSAFVLGPALTSLPLSKYFDDRNVFDYVRLGFLLDIRYYLPGVFDGNPVKNSVNGSLWTLPLEVSMYLMLPLLALISQNRARTTIVTALLFASVYVVVTRAGIDYRVPLFGEARDATKNAAIFFVGAALASKSEWTPTAKQALIALALMAITTRTQYSDVSFILLAPFTVLGLGLMPSRMQWMRNLDISYGVYLYAFPMQQAAYQLFRDSGPAVMAAASLLGTMALAVASWYLVERPFINRTLTAGSGSAQSTAA